MPAPATRTRTSWSPGSGTGRSSTTSPPPSLITSARMTAKPNRRSQPALRLGEEVPAHGQAALERLAHRLLSLEDLRQRDLLAGHNGEAALGGVGGRRERVDGRHLERQLAAPDP